MKIGLLYGGVSVEHEISIISAMQIYEVIKTKHNVINIYYAKDNKFYIGDILNSIENYKDLDSIVKNCVEVTFVSKGSEVFLQEQKLFGKKHQIDLAFLALHGATGEDGRIQGFLDVIGLPYTGPSHYGSTIGQDKIISKDILKTYGINVLNYCTVYDYMSIDEIKSEVNSLTYPLIIKPATLGSSVGIAFCDNEVELEEAVLEAFKYEHKLIVEHRISNFIEVNCSVLGSYKAAKASVLEQVMNDTDFLSFESKYTSGAKSKGMASAKREVPANISEELTKKAQELCLQAFKVLNLGGVVRFDLMVYDNEVYINEVNTIPGSLAFYLWEHTGISRAELYDQLIKLAVEKKRILESKTSFYETNVLETGNFNGKKK